MLVLPPCYPSNQKPSKRLDAFVITFNLTKGKAMIDDTAIHFVIGDSPDFNSDSA